jgi:hypothetical protein
MVLYLTADEVLTFEPCDVMLQKEAQITSDATKRALYEAKLETIMASIEQKLIYSRRKDEIGMNRPRTKHHSHRGHKKNKRKGLRGGFI